MYPIIEHLEYPFGKGDLTADGLQYSAEVDTASPDIDVAVETVEIRLPALGALLEVEFGLTAALRAVSSLTADLTYQWQARNKGGAWVDLHATVLKSNPGTAYTEETRSGRFALTANFNSLPCEVRLVVQCNEANEGRAKVKNSSYLKIKYAGA
jgi:hypothetical protein